MKIRVGIIGGAGYTGGELIRLLLNHPYAEIIFVQSNSNSGKEISEVHKDLLGETPLIFSADLSLDTDVLFLCGGHGAAKTFLLENQIPERIAIIDLSHDFRLFENNAIQGRSFVYGLPELNKNTIAKTKNIANPGCFATSILLALLPFAKKSLLPEEIHINATTGSTGAGQAPTASTHFSWRNNNLSVYKPFTHQHLSEINESLKTLQGEFKGEINFIPQRGDFTRGILSVIHFKCSLESKKMETLFKEYYASHPFIRISSSPIDLKQVVNTNRCFISITKHNDYVLINSAIDNLLKGASGQAVQNMNILFGLDETIGLKLKPSAF